MSINTKFLYLTTFLFIFSANQIFGQGYYKVTKGNDDNTIVEQTNDDINTMQDVLQKYEIQTEKMSVSKENYQYWVSFLHDNKLPAKRKQIIMDFLATMKNELKQ